MLVSSTNEFQAFMFEQLHFLPEMNGNYTCYSDREHPEGGYCCIYCREGCYQLGIADYTIPEDFSVSFRNPARQLRFGVMLSGKTHFKLYQKDAASFTPSSFIVLEENIKGQQAWRAGDHFHGLELTVSADFIENVLYPVFPDCVSLSAFEANYTYKMLPAGVINLLNQMHFLHEKDALTPLYLEGLILQCLALLAEEFAENSSHVIAPKSVPAGTLPATSVRTAINKAGQQHIPHGKVMHTIKVSDTRTITLSTADLSAVHLAHDILTEKYKNPPTVHELSEQVSLSMQKLNYAFLHEYDTTISDYIISLKMEYGAKLLSETLLGIDEIALQCGYHYPANFIRMFKKYYGVTPLQFRKFITR